MDAEPAAEDVPRAGATTGGEARPTGGELGGERARATAGGAAREEGRSVVPRELVERVLRDFEAHASRYDFSYGADLGAALRRAGESPAAVLAAAAGGVEQGAVSTAAL